MKRIAKLACFALLGFMVATVIYWVLLDVLEPICSRSGGSPESYTGVAFSVVVPVALFLGSSLTALRGKFPLYPERIEE
jgi:hypothetical protein